MLLRRIFAACRPWAALLSAVAVIAQEGYSQAKDTTAPPPPPAVTITGFVDTYFEYNFDRPKSRINELRNFDVSDEQFIVSMAEVSVQRAASPVGFRIDFDMGQGNDIVQSGAPGSLANLRQAYVTLVAPVGSGLTIDMGKFVTHCCFEVIPAKDNYNYSRSLLFAWSVPYYHIGARAAYSPSSQLTLNGYLYDGWNGIPVNSGKTLGFEAAYAPTSSLSFVLNWLGGPALPDTITNKYRNVYEFIATYQATDKLTLALNWVYGEDHPPSMLAVWRGIAGYVKYACNDFSTFAVRAEMFSDPEGFMTGASQDVNETTLTYEYKPFPTIILRAEYRYDWSTVTAFDSDTDRFARRNQATFALGAIVTF
jgi:hypothetical protein